MKIEAGESLFLSWLRHVKECQLVQTNWKPSPQWELKNEDILDKLMQDSSEVYKAKYNYDLYKGTKGIDQLLRQAEIDVIGIAFDEGKTEIYAIDVAFHEAGLNHGTKEETIARVTKKCLRTAMCIYGYYGYTDAEIIFASPKINPNLFQEIIDARNDMLNILHRPNLNYKIRIIANQEFREQILSPVLTMLNNVADTSELFMRSLQLYRLIEGMKPSPSIVVESTHKMDRSSSISSDDRDDPFVEMKIGLIAKAVFREILESGIVPEEEIIKMQDKEFSRKTFHIQYPVLQFTNNKHNKRPDRYFKDPAKIYDKYYYICSEWYEKPNNNDRPYLIEWIKRYSLYNPPEINEK